MQLRPATSDDLTAITALQRRWDTAWFGAPEHDGDEVAEELGFVPDLATGTVLIHRGGRLVAAAWWWGVETGLLVDPDIPRRREVADVVVGHLVEAGVRDIAALDRDTDVIDAVLARGWTHARSGFDLHRDAVAHWDLPAPRWPDGITIGGFADDDVAAVHSLVYDAARWTDVAGHVRRDADEWARLFTAGPIAPADQIVAWRGSTPIGVALIRTFSDGTGWVNQLAVATDERRSGLGRSLLLEALHRLRAHGARQLGLGVQAANAGALALYESVGLRVEREYRQFTPPA